jgi:tetratricopeptide (TPR) repeat protein
MNWDFYSQNKTLEPQTAQLLNVIESALKQNPLHPGANHFYIHVIEQSKNPSRATASADLLRTLVPGAEHLVHMPAHIYLLTGRYHEASLANQNAIVAFKQYQESCRKQGFEPQINYQYQHNFLFLIATAAMEGRSQLALAAQKELIRQTPLSIAKQGNLQFSLAAPYIVKARFGLWQEILLEPKPLPEFQYLKGMWHYSGGMAFAHLENFSAASLELKSLISFQLQPLSYKTVNNMGAQQLTIAVEVLKTTIAGKKGQTSQQLKHWRNAVELQEKLPYIEPPLWYFPTKQGLGFALLKAKKPQEAEQVFTQDLAQYPNNGWSLFGLAQALYLQGKNLQADKILDQFNQAWKYADVLPTTGF